MASMIPEIMEDSTAVALNSAAGVLASLDEYKQAILSLQGGLNARALMIGKLLVEVEALLLGNKMGGGFNRWVEQELQWDRRTAYNYRELWRSYGHMLSADDFAALKIPLTGWYELSKESTPEPVRKQLLAEAQDGKQLSIKYIYQTVQRHREQAVLDRSNAPGAHSATRGGTAAMPATLCLFCREQNVVIFPLPNSRSGICKKCCEDAFAFHAQT